ncbi:hypothetical protein [Sphingomonas sp.]|jgi:hypothetical protein|uniref:hypothetical protein n=1 Tax=Sphingomonas sp. TaxID=28214 RepID=UPI002EDBB50C
MNHRSHAFLALLAAAANEAIRTGRCDPLAPNRDPLGARTSALFDATLGSIPLRVCMSDWRSDETRFAVVAWPTREVDQWVEAFGANELAGDVTAIGYLIRAGTGRLRLSDPFEPTVFMRRDRVLLMKSLPAPDDAADPFQLYPRYLSYAAAA